MSRKSFITLEFWGGNRNATLAEMLYTPNWQSDSPKRRRSQAPQEQPILSRAISLKEWTDRMTAASHGRTAANYQTALRSLTTFLGYPPLLADLTEELLAGYERWLHLRHVCPNTASCYMRSLRALYRKAVAAGAVVDRRPFGRVFTGRRPTERRALSEDELRQLRQLSLSPGTSTALSRDLFLFSVYALGMPFIDIAYLRHEQVSGDMLVYQRHKTGQRVRVHIEPCMRTILCRHATTNSPYLFPLLTATDPIAAERQYRNCLSAHNAQLRRLGRQAHLSRPLSSYCARHTWASLAYAHNVELSVIAKALGHTNTDTTLLYIRSINDERLDDANKKLLKEI